MSERTPEIETDDGADGSDAGTGVRHATRQVTEGGGPAAVGALDGAAAAGGPGAVSRSAEDGSVPTDAADPAFGAD